MKPLIINGMFRLFYSIHVPINSDMETETKIPLEKVFFSLSYFSIFDGKLMGNRYQMPDERLL